MKVESWKHRPPSLKTIVHRLVARLARVAEGFKHLGLRRAFSQAKVARLAHLATAQAAGWSFP